MNNTPVKTSPTLESVQQRFETWRSHRAKRDRIPEYLWEAAARACELHSVAHVSRSLRLSYTKLKKRVSSKPSEPHFMAIDLSCVSGAWQLECDRPDGASLRLSGSGPPPAVDHLLGVFLS